MSVGIVVAVVVLLWGLPAMIARAERRRLQRLRKQARDGSAD